MSPNRRLFLIDGYSQVYRAYHGIRGLTGPDGQSTNAVFGFITMLRKLIDDEQPELIAAAFDLRGPTFRHEMADDYKANRLPMPDDLVEQIPLVHEACAALGVPIVTYQGFESDDVMGTLAVQALTPADWEAAAGIVTLGGVAACATVLAWWLRGQAPSKSVRGVWKRLPLARYERYQHLYST